ncbi:MAG TPA: FG-GAP-like repeat-containing protein [Pyrinomonadaceae bacterium]|nr:FG-GAP-like repeat-containing protein [Pyrinomonadaceae bacterium]
MINVILLIGLSVCGSQGSIVYAAECNAPNFNVAPTINLGRTTSVAVADFDGDGRDDIAAARRNDVAIMFSRSEGSFTAPTPLKAGKTPALLAVADFNLDGKPDLVVMDTNFATVTILLGLGNGAFATPSSFPTGPNPFEMAVGDLNGDGLSDIVTANANASNVSVLLNTGGGTLSAATTYAIASHQPLAVAIADINGDGKNDLVVVGSSLWLLAGRGDGTFSAPTNPYLSSPIFAVAAGDLNADGKPDLALAENGGATILLGAGGGSFSAPVRYMTGAEVRAIVITDLNGDGKRDVAVANRDADTATVLLGDGSGGFPSSTTYIVGGGPVSLGVGDFNSDGLVDFAAANAFYDYVTVMFGSGKGKFRAPTVTRGGADPGSVTLGDFNADGKLDLVVPNSRSNTVSVSLGAGDGTFGQPALFAVGTSPGLIAVADFNNDGKNDLAVSNQGSNTVSILIGDGTGGFGAPTNLTAGTNPYGLAVADFNGDGRADLAIANIRSSFLTVYLGSSGGFSAAANYDLPLGATRVVAGDFNGDGRVDLVAALAAPNEFVDSISVLLGDGTGGFAAAINTRAGSQPGAIVVADFNRDGKADIALRAVSLGDSVSVLLGDGHGGFAAPVNYYTGFRSGAVAIGDFNRDGLTDLAVTSDPDVMILTGRGDGTFDQPVGFTAGRVYSLAAGDLNGDGKSDLALASFTDSYVSLLLNTDAPGFAFGKSFFSAGEETGSAVITINRGGDTSVAASVELTTVDDPSAVRCDTVNGTAYARCDYATTVETVTFAPGETSKSVTIPLINDAYVEVAESVRLRLTGATLCTPVESTLVIQDNDTNADVVNPIFTTPFFVRMQYLDFLSREPEAGEPWSAILNNCPDVNNNPACDRITVSQSFFGSPEFRLKGFYVFNFYKVAFNRRPAYDEIIPDMRSVSGATAAEVYQKRAAYPVNFTARAEFKGLYNALTNTAFVNTLFDRYGLGTITTPDPVNPEGGTKVLLTRADLINSLGGQSGTRTLTRAQVLRALVESNEVSAAEYNRAFVAMQYYGYLRRTPEEDGYQAWLRVINQDPNNIRVMVNGFMNSPEYRLRFGQP